MPSDVAGVRGGRGCIPPAPGCAVRRQAPAVAGAAWGLQGSRCPAWLVHACIVVSLGGWRAPEEARAIWRGGRRDGCSPKEGFPGSSRLQHALMPMRACQADAYPCTSWNTHCVLDIADDERVAFSILLVGNQIAGSGRPTFGVPQRGASAPMSVFCTPLITERALS
jgi:hypothetical protein